MNINSSAEVLQTGFHIAMGAASYVIEILGNPQKLQEDLTKPPQPLEQLIQELAAKGEKTELEVNNFVKQFFPDANYSVKYPQYVERPNEQCFLQPFNLKNANVYGFFLEGSLEKLQKLCDKYLNEPSDGKVQYRPATNYVLMTFATIDSLSSIERPDSEKVYCSEEEAVFWVVAVAGKQIGSAFVGERLVCFMPYIFVNDSPILVSGREIYGICKEIGFFQIPHPEEKPELFTVDTLAWKNFSSEAHAKKQRLLEVVQIEKQDKTQREQTLNTPDELMELIRKLIFQNQGNIEIPSFGWSLPLNIIESLTYKSVRTVFLKQFRDIEDGRRACYQAIVECLMKISQYHQGKILSFGDIGDKFELKIYNFASHPIVEELGLQGIESLEKESVRLPIKLAYWLNFDFILENGTVIWKTQ
ncbi:hypothetical protein NSTC745_04455 [Nostoc sp. DSM 114161]|jgi:hypothetical protein|uniref:hypothetical protein n=1 Tax=Nostoc sp. DSM 114161 TaxID=3440143 RepID=UPI0040467C45